MGPNARSAASSARGIEASSVTSAAPAIALPCPDAMVAAVSSAPAGLRSMQATETPWRGQKRRRLPPDSAGGADDDDVIGQVGKISEHAEP